MAVSQSVYSRHEKASSLLGCYCCYIYIRMYDGAKKIGRFELK